MTASSVPAIGVPVAGEALGPAAVKVYASRPGKQWRFGLLSIVLGLFGLTPLPSVLHWLHGGRMPENEAFSALLCLLFLPFGLLLIANALRGLPRLTIMPQGVKLDYSIGTRWADWDSLQPFAVRTTYAGLFRRPVHVGYAKIVGENASKGLFRAKIFSIPDHFRMPVETIVADLNAARAQAAGTSEAFIGPAIIPDLPVGVADFKMPWVTFALLAILLVIFSLENVFAVSPAGPSGPSIATLFAMGALSRTAVLSGGEWYRLFTAPLLHANFAHILGNGVALLWGGWMLERLVGRLWFFAFFVIGALGGSLMSLAVGAPQLISVGASGALMGLFAALFISSFRMPPGTAARHRLQGSSLRILVPSLLPLFSPTSGGHIDYGAHFGGAIAGTIAAALLLKAWPVTARIPQLPRIAAGLCIVGAALFIGSAGLAIANYPKYDVVAIPEAEFPKTVADRKARAADLVARYPKDPRSHLLLGMVLAGTKDNVGTERELRLALAIAQAHVAVFRPQTELAMRAFLALFLAEQGRRDEAKDLARATCLAPAGDKGVDDLVKSLTAQHLCD